MLVIGSNILRNGRLVASKHLYARLNGEQGLRALSSDQVHELFPATDQPDLNVEILRPQLPAVTTAKVDTLLTSKLYLSNMIALSLRE